MKNGVLRVGVIGCGAIAQRRHLPEYAENRRVRLTGLYDPNAGRLAELCCRYGTAAYDSAGALIASNDIDAVSICTPNHLHASLAEAALRAGKHVLLEKPMALNTAESASVMTAARETGRVLMLGHNQRLVPAHMKAKELYEQGAIGTLLGFECNFQHAGPENWSVDGGSGTWFFSREYTGFGVLGDLGAHKIDLIRWLIGTEFEKVSAMLCTVDKRDENGKLIVPEDSAFLLARMKNGVPGTLRFSWTDYGAEDNSTVLYGTRGVMKIYRDPAADIVLENRDGTRETFSVGAISTNTSQLKSGVIDLFVEAVLDGREPLATGADGHNTLAVIQAAQQSFRLEQWVNVETAGE